MKKTTLTNCRGLRRGVVALLLLTVSVAANAYDFSAKNNGITIYYNILSSSDMTCEVTYKSDRYPSRYNSYSGNVVIPETVKSSGTTYTVTEIGKDAFEDCTGLRSVTIGNNVTTIGIYAFLNCTGLTSVTFGNSVTEIGIGAFGCCTGMTSLTIPNSVTEIGEQAFQECTGLTSITIPSSVTKIGKAAFEGCTGVTKFEVAEGNEYYCAVDGVLYSKDMTKLFQLPVASTETSYDIPESVTAIGDYAFEYCTGLTEIIIPDSVTIIGVRAFGGCSGLTNVTIGNKVREIDYGAFEDCTGLTEIIIPNSVIGIGSYAFDGCSGLTEVTIGESLTNLSGLAFCDCTGLTSIYSLNPEPPSCSSFGGGVFCCVDKSACVLYVPIGSKGAYSTAYAWQDFLNIVEMDMTPVNGISAGDNVEVTGYYTTDGKLLGAPQRGINIIRYSDGTARKVLVR